MDHDEIVHRREVRHQAHLDKANLQIEKNARIKIWFERVRDHIIRPVIKKFPVKIPLAIREKMPLLGVWRQNAADKK